MMNGSCDPLVFTTAVNTLAAAIAAGLDDNQLGLVAAVLHQLGTLWRPSRPKENAIGEGQERIPETGRAPGGFANRPRRDLHHVCGYDMI